MGYTDLYSDESIILETKNVKVKSIPFDAILTTRRLLLVDNKKNVIPQQNIPLTMIRRIEPGENAIRDPTVTISIITETGKMRQMILTFSRQAGGERKRECDDWVALLKERVDLVQPKEQPSPKAPEPEPEPRYESAPTPQIAIPSTPSGKKKIEIARPIKKIIEKSPVYPQPVETTSLPQGSFCRRCGNRIPPESTFCNRCGTKVAVPEEITRTPETTRSHEKPAEPEKVTGSIRIPVTAYTNSKSFERKERPIEKIIHSIEPLIEDSVPRTESEPEVAEPVTEPEPAPVQAPALEPVQEPVQEPEASDSPLKGISFPVLAHTGKGTDSASETPAEQPESPPAEPTREGLPAEAPAVPASPVIPPVPASAPSRKPRLIALSIIIILIIAIAGGALLFSKNLTGQSGDTTALPEVTTLETTIATTMPTPVKTPTVQETTIAVPTEAQVMIPSAGVWVRIIYDGKYAGTYGTPGRQIPVSDTGDHFYQVPTLNDPVDASIKKTEGNSAELVIEVYKDGSLVKRSTTTAPFGTIEFEAVIKTPTPTTVPTTIATTVTTEPASTINVTATATQK